MTRQIAKDEKPRAPEPNDRDKAAIARAYARFETRGKRASVKVSGTGAAVAIDSPHSDVAGHRRQLMDAFGTPSSDFAYGALALLLEALTERGADLPSEVATNAAIAMVSGVEPANELEAMIASQMAATHSLAMNMLGRARRVEQLNQLDAQGGLAVKLLRTFAMQAEALAKLRRGGSQIVRVEHVHVHAGGQAIVGNVAPGGGAQSKSEDQPYAKHVEPLAHADAPFDPLRSKDAKRDVVPLSRHA